MKKINNSIKTCNLINNDYLCKTLKQIKNMTEFDKANMDGSLERDFYSKKYTSKKNKTKQIFTVEIVDEDLKVYWSSNIDGARGTKHARDLFRVQYPEIRSQYIGKGYMVRVKTYKINSN